MSHEEERRPASFRGIGFFVRRSTTTHVPFVDVQDIPGRETTGQSVNVKSLGAGQERFQITAFVSGPTYRDRRDALVAALMEGTTGRLVHPFYGERDVRIVSKIPVVETTQNLGKATITFECVRQDGAGLQTSADTAAIAERDLDAAIAELAAEFDASYPADAPASQLTESASTWDSAVAGLDSATGQISGLARTATSLQSDLNQSLAEGTQFITKPTAAFTELAAAARSLGNWRSSAGRIVEEQAQGLAEVTFGIVRDALLRSPVTALLTLPPTTSRANEVAAVNAVTRGVYGAGLLAASYAVSTSRGIVSQRAAHAIRDELAALYDGYTPQISATAYAVFRRAQTSILAHLTTVAASLPEVVDVRITEDEPALVLAHRLYGDARKESDIRAWNPTLRSPHRIPAETVLETRRGV